MPYNKDEFIKRLKELRVGKSRRKVSLETGIKEPTLVSWEIGRSEPSLESLWTICAAYGVSADYLLGLTDEPHGYAAAITQSISQSLSGAHNTQTVAPPPAPSCRDCEQVAALTRIIERLVPAPTRAPTQG